jgi:excinuclease UvrABC nuclease subunit
VVSRFGNLWKLRQAAPEDLAAIRTIPGALAEQVVAAVR